jgi:anti-sigma regulatory factor (Ser/Thr protein kinase)
MDADISLPRSSAAPAAARSVVRDLLVSRSWGRRAVGDAELVVSELVANAIRHGEGEVRLRLIVQGSTLAGEVVDEGTGIEQEVRAVGVDEFGGRGLQIVATLATQWGIHEGSSHVWFEIDDRPETAQQPEVPQLGAQAKPDGL